MNSDLTITHHEYTFRTIVEAPLAKSIYGFYQIVLEERSRPAKLEIEMAEWLKLPTEKENLEEFILAYFTGVGNPPNFKEISREVLYKTFREYFGQRVVDDVMAFYEIFQEASLEEVKALLIGIKANLTLRDVRYLESHPFFQKVYQHYLPINTDEQLGSFVHAFRVTGSLDILSSELSKKSQNQLKNDLEILNASAAHVLYAPIPIEEDRPITLVQEFGEEEYFGKRCIYSLYAYPGAEFSEKLLFPCYLWDPVKKEKRLGCVQARKLFAQNGIFAATILPALIQKWTPCPIRIVFRGTYDSSSLKRVLSLFDKTSFFTIEGPGAKSFEESYPELKIALLSQLAKLRRHYQISRFKVGLIGHSLGVGDSCHIMYRMVQEEAFCKFIESFQLDTWQGTRPSSTMANRFLDMVEENWNINFLFRYHMMEGDLVQEGGSVFFGYSDRELPENFTIDLLKYRLPRNVDTFRNRHSTSVLAMLSDIHPTKVNPTELQIYLSNRNHHPLAVVDLKALNLALMSTPYSFVARIYEISATIFSNARNLVHYFFRSSQ